MKALIGNAILFGLAVATASVVGCSSGSSSTNGHITPASNVEDGTGTIGMSLTLAGGGQINSVNYTVNGPNGASTIVTQGTINIANSTGIVFEATGIPAGSGYTVTLSGADSTGDTCLGTSAPFAVTARTETNVIVQLQCHGTASQNGSVGVTGVISNCATWQSIATNPGETTIGFPALISFSSTGPDKGSLTFSTTVSGPGAGSVSPATGSVSATAGATASFNCTAPGLETVTFVFGDGVLPPGGSCDTSLDTTSVTIQCDGVAVDAGVTAVDSGTTVDSSVVDTGIDTGVDAGIDTGVDAGIDTGVVGDLACAPFNGGLPCTPTEELFVKHDPTLSCYTCLVNNGALDDTVFPDTGHECADVTGNATGGAGVGTSRTQLCLNTLACILGTPSTPTCATGGQPTFCFCGTGVGPAACSALAGAPTGQCTQQEADGLELPASPTIPVLKAFPNASLGAGIANAIINQAAANSCTSCF